MSQLPKDIVRRSLAAAEELPAARAWAERKGLELEYDEQALRVRIRLFGPTADGEEEREPYLLQGELDDYPLWPPLWTFLDPRSSETIGPAAYPAPSANSVLHPSGLVCAPWSRAAYQSLGGPHGDWGDFSFWRNADPVHTQASTVPDMLDRLFRDTRASRGRMAPLPS